MTIWEIVAFVLSERVLLSAVKATFVRVVDVDAAPEVPATRVTASRWNLVLAAASCGGVVKGWSAEPGAAVVLSMLLASGDQADSDE